MKPPRLLTAPSAPDAPRRLAGRSKRTPLGNPPAGMTHRDLEFCSHPGNLSLVRRFVRQFLVGEGCGESLVELMVLGIDEACTNVIRYAYGCADSQWMRLTLESSGGAVRCRLRDYGKPLCVTQLNGRCLEAVRPGGLGLHLIRQAFDRAYYLRKPKGTELVMIKALPVECQHARQHEAA